jgi:hypothetical protein
MMITKKGIVTNVAATVLCLVAGVRLASASAPPFGFQCYKVKDAAAKATLTATTVTFLPGWTAAVSDTGCVLKSPPKVACLPAAASVTGSMDGLFVFAQSQDTPVACYAVKCPKPTGVVGTLSLTDAAGTHSLTPKPPSLLCVPACVESGAGCFKDDQCCSGTCNAGTCS